MINFYSYYTGNGLDNESYGQLFDLLYRNDYDKKLEPVKHIIKKTPFFAYRYAREVLKDRWLEAEPYIMKDTWHAYCYAAVIMEDRWLEAEPYIMKDPSSSHLYARYVIKGRWIDAESYIMKDGTWWGYYCVVFGI